MMEIMKARKNLRKRALVAFFAIVLLISPGCALLWLGAGGAGGYLIRKGEESGGGGKREVPADNKESTKRSETY